MKWQSEEHVGLAEAAEWARHFGDLERDMDRLLADMLGVEPDVLDKWINPGKYISGREFAEAGFADLVPLIAPRKERNGSARNGNNSGNSAPVANPQTASPQATSTSHAVKS